MPGECVTLAHQYFFVMKMPSALLRRLHMFKCKSDFFIMEAITMNPCPEVIKLFPCSTQLSTKFILIINVKMATIVGILTFISMINV